MLWMRPISCQPRYNLGLTGESVLHGNIQLILEFFCYRRLFLLRLSNLLFPWLSSGSFGLFTLIEQLESRFQDWSRIELIFAWNRGSAIAIMLTITNNTTSKDVPLERFNFWPASPHPIYTLVICTIVTILERKGKVEWWTHVLDYPARKKY